MIVLTVPMRNGNFVKYGNSSSELGSYRTYEEWKHISNHRYPDNFYVGSYRTYEEWKRLY